MEASRPVRQEQAPPAEPTDSSSLVEAPLRRSRSLDDVQQARPAVQRRLSAKDVLHKTCFVCLVSEDDEEDLKKAEFIHACSCSLMAHQSCLLKWVSEAQQRSGDVRVPASRREVKCPSCGTPYRIVQDSNALLDLFDILERHFNRLAVQAALVTSVGGLTAASGVYGLLAARAFVGRAYSNMVFNRVLPGLHYTYLSLIAPALIMNRIEAFSGVLYLIPLLVPSIAIDFRQEVGWPPGPFLSLAFLPEVRTLYRWLRRKVWRIVLARIPAPALVDEPRRPLIAVIAPDDPAEAAPPDQAGAAENNRENGPEPAQQQNVAGGIHIVEEERARIRLSMPGLARLAMGALLWPFLSSAAGSALLWLIKPSSANSQLLSLSSRPGYLRSFLGLADDDVFRSALGWPPKWSPFRPEPGSILQWLSERLGIAFKSSWPGAPIDPIWWRNAVGGSLLVVFKDLGSLLRAVLERRRLATRRIQPVEISRSLNLELR